MEPLVELPIEKWPDLQEKLKSLWPLNVAGFYSLNINLKCPGVREAFQFKVYCPYGDMDNGFVSINVKPGGSQDCILFSTNPNTSKLESALANTKLIDWSQKVCVDCINSVILKSLDNVRAVKEFTTYDVGIVKTFFLDRETKPFNLRFPLGTCVAPVKHVYLEHIDNVWPYSFPGSIQYFSVFISNGLSYGLYCNDELAAWVFLNEYNFILHLYCEEKYRRKGFAETLIKYVIN
ncbi:hypothetical protein O0L34_g7877 [Tuta absoluta]|nr:hypothetical protein O0L34_g7877 [Tuta absoluta]